MREGLRRELLTQKVIDREIASKVAVSDKEITDFFNANRAQFNIAEKSSHIAQIVITPVRDAQSPTAPETTRRPRRPRWRRPGC